MNSNSFGGTHRIISVNYLFGWPFIPSDFLKGIVTLNFRETTNFMSVVVVENVVLGSEKKTVTYHVRKADKSTQDQRFSGNGQKRANKFENI